MKKKQEKAKYESPFTKKTTVILENGICAGSADLKNPDGDNGRIQKHEVNSDFGFKFEESEWDK